MKKNVFTIGFIFTFLVGQQSELKNVTVLPLSLIHI